MWLVWRFECSTWFFRFLKFVFQEKISQHLGELKLSTVSQNQNYKMAWIRRDLKDNLVFTLCPSVFLPVDHVAQIASNQVLNTSRDKETTAISSCFVAVNVSMNVFHPQPPINFNGIQIQSIFFPHVCFWEKIMLSENNFFLYVSFIMQAITKQKPLYTSKGHHTHRTDQIS